MAEGLDPLVWLRTSDVCARIHISDETLRRYQKKGVLKEGIHFVKGATKNSPTRWDVLAVAQALAEAKK